MSNPLLLDLTLYLQTEGLVQGDGIDVYRDFQPATPDDLVMLMEYAGSPLLYFEQNVTNRSVQVLVRSLDADAARDKALALFDSFRSDTTRVDFTEERWGQVYLRQTPFRIKKDDAERIYYGFNMGITTTVE